MIDKRKEYDYDCFISYNWNDEIFVKDLVKTFNEAGIKFFLDKSELKLYDKLSTTLKQNVFKSKFLISIISQNYLKSYWCMFEALEAISQENIEIKFLPVVLKYDKNEPNLDENFVFESIENLTNEIQILENKIISSKAFKLSDKLDKLNFIKQNLPKIYVRIQENIYPIFELWNNNSTDENLKKLLEYIIPEKKHKVNNFISTNYKNPKIADFNSPSLNLLPEVKWSINIGKQKWKNTPLIIGDDIFVGSAGDEWNLGDDKDGVYCINALTGRIKWFFPTNSDVNEINFFDGEIIGGCDNGKVICLSAKNGKLLWEQTLDSGVTAKIYKDSNLFERDYYIVCTYNGNICFLDTKNGSTVYTIQTETNIIGNPYFGNDFLYVQTIQGYLIKLKENFGKFEIEKKLIIKYPDEHNRPENLSRGQLYSTPLIVEGLMYLAVARQTYYDYPPIMCIDIKSNEIKWIAKDRSNSSYGNVRTELLSYNDLIIFIHSYSNEIVALAKNSGEVKWKINIGRSMFQQWSSPILIENNLYIGRHDGYLYKVDIEKQEREWSIYLGNENKSGIVFDKLQEQSNEKENTVWDLYKGFPILSTPANHRNKNIIIGTDEGYLYCITNLNNKQ